MREFRIVLQRPFMVVHQEFFCRSGKGQLTIGLRTAIVVSSTELEMISGGGERDISSRLGKQLRPALRTHFVSPIFCVA